MGGYFMGIYNEYYQKYYSNMKKQTGTSEYKPTKYSGNSTKGSNNKLNSRRNTFPIYLNIFGKGFANILIIQCVIVLVLLAGLFLARTYPNSYVNKVYDKSIAIINNGLLKEKNITVENIVQAFKKKNILDVFKEEKITEVFNEVKSMVSFEEKKENYIKENYVNPITIKDKNQITIKDNRLSLSLTNESDIKASFPGKVKSVTEGKEITLILDYGDGIEMKYYGLSGSKVKIGNAVDTGEVIGTVKGDEGNILSIEVFYMGNILNPEKCFNFETMI